MGTIKIVDDSVFQISERSKLFLMSYFPALILKILSMIYKLVQSNTYATKR